MIECLALCLFRLECAHVSAQKELSGPGKLVVFRVSDHSQLLSGGLRYTRRDMADINQATTAALVTSHDRFRRWRRPGDS